MTGFVSLAEVLWWCFVYTLEGILKNKNYVQGWQLLMQMNRISLQKVNVKLVMNCSSSWMSQKIYTVKIQNLQKFYTNFNLIADMLGWFSKVSKDRFPKHLFLHIFIWNYFHMKFHLPLQSQCKPQYFYLTCSYTDKMHREPLIIVSNF